MNLYEIITTNYPELTETDFYPVTGCINLRDDSDGQGAYIEKWEYNKPLPAGLKIGK